MPLDPIKNFILDKYGVVVDTDPLVTPPEALTKAQNATNDLYGEKGSLRKRPGLAKFNTSAATGNVLGGVGVPIFLGSAGPDFSNPFAGEAVTIAGLTASATTTVGNFPQVIGNATTFNDDAYEYGWDRQFDFTEIPYVQWLDYIGANNLNTLDVSGDNQQIQATTGSTATGLAYFGGGSVDNSALLWVLVAASDVSQITNSVSSTYTGTSFLVFPTHNNRQYVGDTGFPFKAWFDGSRVGLTTPSGSPTAVSGNILYYCPQDAPKAVRAFDGQHDTLACTLPTGVSVMSLYAANGVLYISSIDVAAHGAAGGTATGSVYQFMPTTGALTRLGAQFPTGHVPYSMVWAYSRLWVGTALQEPTTDTTACRVYWIRPATDTAFTLDNTFSNYEDTVTQLVVFQGLIYAALTNHQTAPTVTTRIAVRSTAGVWTTSDSINDTANDARTKGYNDMIVWPVENGPVTSPAAAIYAINQVNNPNVITVRKFNGSSWSTTATLSSTAADGGFGSAAVANPSSSNKLVPVLWINSLAKVYNSTDGTTFTDQTSSFPSQYTTISSPRGIGGIVLQVAH